MNNQSWKVMDGKKHIYNFHIIKVLILSYLIDWIIIR